MLLSAKDNIHFPHGVDLKEFSKDYEDKSMTALKIQKKYRISPRQYRLVVRYLLDTVYPKTKQCKSVDKHIYKSSYGKFVVRKTVNGKFGYYGSYDTLKEARKIRDRLEKYNWDRRVI